MPTETTVAPARPDHTPEIPERVIASLVRTSFEDELRTRIDDALDRQLAVFFATQAVPSRSVRAAA
jgi:hypothetical protein